MLPLACGIGKHLNVREGSRTQIWNGLNKKLSKFDIRLDKKPLNNIRSIVCIFCLLFSHRYQFNRKKTDLNPQIELTVTKMCEGKVVTPLITS